MAQFRQARVRDDFKIALICALRVECDAVEALFDEFYPSNAYGTAPGDPNSYSTGRIGEHNVVLAYMPGMGKASAAGVASSFRSSFNNINLGLVVGICGGVPKGTDDEKEILLGDVIISTGLVQYDFGRQQPDRAVRKDTLEDKLGRQNLEIRGFLARISTLRGRSQLRNNTVQHLGDICKMEGFEDLGYPGPEKDKLFKPTYRHKHQNPSTCEVCAACGSDQDKVCPDALKLLCTELGCANEEVVARERLRKMMETSKSKSSSTEGPSDRAKPMIHFGLIASGDLVMKSGNHRDRIAVEERVIAFEMEGAGVWDNFPTVVIKSVCDYADSHKNKEWQNYAAATAAACMKAFLSEWRASNEPTQRQNQPAPAWSRNDLQTRLNWLKYCSSSEYLESALSKRAPGTGDWFLQNDFLTWKEKQYSLLWMVGKAGCGKTVLCSTIISEIQTQSHNALAYFYFSFRRKESQGLRQLLHAVLTQLVRASARPDGANNGQYYIPDPFTKLYDRHIFESDPSIEDLKKTLLELLQESKSSFIIIDALDECEPQADRAAILQFLRWLHGCGPSRTRILITSRLTDELENCIEDLTKLGNFYSIPIENAIVDGDIEKYVDHCLKVQTPFRGWTGKIKDTVKSKLTEKSYGVFRWTECQLKELAPKERDSEIVAALEILPNDLDETYARMLAKIESSNYATEAITALHWLAFSTRTLTARQLAESAAFSIDRAHEPYRRPLSFDPKDRFHNAMRLCHILSDLITVAGRSLNTEDENEQNSAAVFDSELTFTHFSVKEYLLCTRVAPSWKLSEELGHSFLVESCLVYIKYYIRATDTPFEEKSLAEYPLISYSCRHWPDHARVTFFEHHLTQHAKEKFLDLFSSADTAFVSSLRIAFSSSPRSERLYDDEDHFASPAYFLAVQDLSLELTLFPRDWNGINIGIEKPFRGVRALHVACSRGYNNTVAALLALGADVNARSKDGFTPLHLAARSGRVATVKEILKWQPDVTALTEDGENAIHSAVRAGNETIIELLISYNCGKQLETRNARGLSPLHLAVKVCNWTPVRGVPIVHKLLDSGAKPKTQTFSGKTCMHEAVENDQLDCIKLLKEHGVRETSHSPLTIKNWDAIRPALQKAFWNDESNLGVPLFSLARNAVFLHCTSPKNSHIRGAHVFGEDLYLGFSKFIGTQLLEIKASVVASNTSSNFCIRESEYLLRFSRKAAQIFGYLDRYWVAREMERRKDIYPICPLLFQRWKEIVMLRERGSLQLPPLNDKAPEKLTPSDLEVYARHPLELYLKSANNLNDAGTTQQEKLDPNVLLAEYYTRASEGLYIFWNKMNQAKEINSMQLSSVKYPYSVSLYMRLISKFLIEKLRKIYGEKDKITLEGIGRLLYVLEEFRLHGGADFEHQLQILAREFRGLEYDDFPSQAEWSRFADALNKRGIKIT